MDRLVKGAWDEPEIPDALYLRARRRAWDRIQTPGRPAGPRRLLWAATALVPAAALMAWLALRGRVAEVPPPPSVAFAPEVRVPPTLGPARHKGLLPAGTTARRSASATPRRPGHDRLVVNLVLPESGVRMIWVLDSDFRLDGGNQ